MGTVAEQLKNATHQEVVTAFLAAVQSVQEKDQVIAVLGQKIESQTDKVASLQHQLSQLQKMIFGARSEKSCTLYTDHPTLFDVPLSEDGPEVMNEEVVIQRKKVV